ncbi:MAG: hypothetical protein H5T62_10495 [Anaerolineae bacterium]|nr:hypothetical protein [Anaerolineae bacterium]
MFEKITYHGWSHCYRLSSDEVELIVTGDVGPRVIHCGFIGDVNEFGTFEEHLGKSGGTEWRMYGGHRLWHAPEDAVRTYYPDNEPVRVVEEGGTLRAIQPPETTTGIQKEIALTFKAANQIEVRHYLRNVGLWPVELAPWALSVMAPGGIGIVPQPRPTSTGGLLPNRTVALWPYTDMADTRFHWGSQFILLRQDEQAQTPVKIGLSARESWIAYLHRDHLFLKTVEYVEGATYPDLGCSLEMYTNNRMLELETLGPLRMVNPQETIEHVEHWFLFRGVKVEGEDEDAIAEAVLPLVAAAKNI